MSSSTNALIIGVVVLVGGFFLIKQNPMLLGQLKQKIQRISNNIIPVSAGNLSNCECIEGHATGVGCPVIGQVCYGRQYQHPKPGKDMPLPNYMPKLFPDFSGV